MFYIKRILEPQEVPVKLWGKQKITPGVYRPLKYLLQAECEDGTLLHNAVTGELLLLDKKEADLFNVFPAEATEPAKELIESHFLVPIDYDEKKAVEQLRNLMRAVNHKKEITGYTILPTTYCNARCFYCYESNFKHVHMSKETAHEVVHFIENHRGDKKISLHWFGGEPLVGSEVIDQITTELKDKEIVFTSSMISNGYLFDAEMVERAKELWKLREVQITLDGTEEVYNKVKAYVAVSGSPFKRVINNIRLLTEKDIDVYVRINLDQHNISDVRNLIDFLLEEFGENEHIKIYVHTVFEDCGDRPILRSSDDDRLLLEKEVEYNSYISERRKYRKAQWLPSLLTSHCMADNPGSVIIHPAGELVRCEHCTPDEKYGTIFSEEYDQTVIDDWMTHVILPECNDCPIYPGCLRVKGCPLAERCPEATRNGQIENLKRRMLGIYMEHKN